MNCLIVIWIVSAVFNLVMCYITRDTRYDDTTVFENGKVLSSLYSVLSGPILSPFFIYEHFNHRQFYNQKKIDDFKNIVYFLPLLSLGLLYFI